MESTIKDLFGLLVRYSLDYSYVDTFMQKGDYYILDIVAGEYLTLYGLIYIRKIPVFAISFPKYDDR